MRTPVIMRGRGVAEARARGFTLIENMVALAVFAIGMMGVVYLYLNGLGLSQKSQGLSQANIAMQEIIGMMRADGNEALLYNGVATRSAALPPSGTLAAANVATWMQDLRALPGVGAQQGGSGTIQVQPINPASKLCPCQANVQIQWGAGNVYQVQTDVDY